MALTLFKPACTLLSSQYSHSHGELEENCESQESGWSVIIMNHEDWPPDDLADPGESWARLRQVCKYCKHGSYLLINPTHTEVCLARPGPGSWLWTWIVLKSSESLSGILHQTGSKGIVQLVWGRVGDSLHCLVRFAAAARYNPLPSTEQSLLFVFTLHTAEIMSVKINFVIPTAGKSVHILYWHGIVVKFKRQIQPFLLLRC